MGSRIHVYFSGMVQGVGFRYTAQRIANDTNITGWVRNLPDGRVEAVCEADPVKLEEFLEKLTKNLCCPLT